jgi:hypothetical protein
MRLNPSEENMPRRLLPALVLVLLCAPFLKPAPETRAAAYVFQVDMYGDEQVPPVNSIGYGFVRFFFNEDRTQADYTVDVKGFGAPSILGADIHRGKPGENGPVIKHLADGDFIVTAGKLRLTESELADMASGDWYVSLKTRDNPRGEFRGQIYLPADFFPGSALAPVTEEAQTEPVEELAAEPAPQYEYVYDYPSAGYDPYSGMPFYYWPYDVPYQFWTVDQLTVSDSPLFVP